MHAQRRPRNNKLSNMEESLLGLEFNIQNWGFKLLVVDKLIEITSALDLRN